MITALAFLLSVAAGVGFDEVIRHGHRTTAATVATSLAGAAATAEWQTIIVGAVIGAVVGVIIDVPDGSMKTRTQMLIVSVGSAAVTTIPIVDRLGWEHSQAALLLVAAAAAFVAWPVLRAARRIDWAAVLTRWIPTNNKKDS
jgi:hypothetical protein